MEMHKKKHAQLVPAQGKFKLDPPQLWLLKSSHDPVPASELVAATMTVRISQT